MRLCSSKFMPKLVTKSWQFYKQFILNLSLLKYVRRSSLCYWKQIGIDDNICSPMRVLMRRHYEGNIQLSFYWNLFLNKMAPLKIYYDRNQKKINSGNAKFVLLFSSVLQKNKHISIFSHWIKIHKHNWDMCCQLVAEIVSDFPFSMVVIVC
jgi:hypothetical protein